jgi:hypothetical protein
LIGGHQAGAATIKVCADAAAGLQRGMGHVHAAANAFFYDSIRYPLEIYSDYALQPNSTNYCILYEAENVGSGDILKFYWPLAAGMEMDKLPPRERQSVLVTLPLNGAPHVAETWIYAFKSGVIKSHAYQKDASIIFDERDRKFSQNENDLLHSTRLEFVSFKRLFGTHTAQFRSPSQSFELNAPTQLPRVGAQFIGSKAEVGAISEAKWDGKAYTITVVVGRNSPESASSLKAPYTYALQKADSASDIMALIPDLQNVELPPTQDILQTTRSLSPVPNSGANLYVAFQPITFQNPQGGRICFLAPVYSPLPIPDKFMSCRPN